LELELKSILGLPAHPLFAHAPVVLLPLTAIGAVVCALSSHSRRRIGWVVVGLAVVTLVSVQLAMSSGEALRNNVQQSRLVHDHAELADALRPFAALLFVAVTALVGLDHRNRRRVERDGAAPSTRARQAVAGLAVVTVIAAGMSTVWVARTGHSGAKAVWDNPNQPMLARSGG
jgi:hypothetical protein